ncbi:hypothetical protein HWV62_309 [Athelia sp. TMB]|nr:hypothetical protein HWV62_309 [Athelia sp. TMB]
MAESQSYILSIQGVDNLRWASSAYADLRTKLLPNLYVEVYVGQTLVARTTVVENSLRPIWAETLTIPSLRESSKLTFKLKHKSGMDTDSCFGTADETVGRLLRLCEGKQVTQLNLERGPEKAWSNAQGLLSVHIKATPSVQAHEKNTLAAQEILERLQLESNDVGREDELSAHKALLHPIASSNSVSGEGSLKEAHYHLQAQNASNPAQQLEELAPDRNDLYKILNSAWVPEMAGACNRILGLIIVSRVPLTDETISRLLEFTDSGTTCRLALRRLGCVVQWSEGQPVRMLSESFSDYITDSSACGSEPWFIDVQEHNLALARACLRIMNAQLRFNMCNLESSHIPNADIEDLSERVETAIPLSLSYPCRFWGHHLQHVPSGEPSVLPLVLQFFESKFLYWLEVLSLLGEVQVASKILLAVKMVVPNDETRLQAFAQDALNFVRVFAPAITYSTPHIYVSCVPLAPPLSVIKCQYTPSLDHTLAISGDVEYGWSALQQVYTGHTREVMSVVFSPDGRRIASGSQDGSIHICNAETGTLAVGPIQAHTGAVYSVAFSPDGRNVVSGSADGTICSWDTETGVLASGPFEGHAESVYSVAFSPDGRGVASGSADCTVRVWDLDTGILVAGPFKGHTSEVYSVAFAPDGRTVASGSGDKTVRIWDIETGCHVAMGHSHYVLSVIFSPDGTHVASGTGDWTVSIWDVETGTLAAGPLEGHTGEVSSVAYSPDGLWVASGSDDQTIRILGLQSSTTTRILKWHDGGVNSIAFSPDGQRIASASEGTFRIWDADAGPLVPGTSEPSKGHSQDIRSIAFSPDGRHIASGSYDQTMCIWDVKTGKLSGGPYEGHRGMVRAVVFSPDGRHVATGSEDRTVRLWDIEMGSHVTFRGHTGFVYSVAFSPDGRKIVSGSDDKTICLWDTETGVLTAGPVEGHGDSVRSVVFSPDGRQVASGSNDQTVRLWSVEGASVCGVRKFEGHTDIVNSVAFSPDGRKVASGSDDKTVRIWDKEIGSHVAVQGHTNAVWSVAFSPDGRHIASASLDQTVRIWDVATGTLIGGPFEGHVGRVSSVALSPDGQLLASSGSFAIRVVDVGALHRQGDRDILSLRPQEQKNDGDKAFEGFTGFSQLQENGWMVTSGGDLLFYVPPDLRVGLRRPHESAVITADERMTRLHLDQFVHGEDWARCHILA